jgi:hypothetical protein
MTNEDNPVVTPAGVPMAEKIENQDPQSPEALQDSWLQRVEEKAANYRKAQNAAQDASEALHEAISAAKAAGVPEARILSVVTV